MTETPKPCPKAKYVKQWKHGPANEPHTCPSQSEIHDDKTTLCECCDTCRQECADDI